MTKEVDLGRWKIIQIKIINNNVQDGLGRWRIIRVKIINNNESESKKD